VGGRCSSWSLLLSTTADTTPSTEPKVGPIDRYHVRRLLGQGPRAVPLVQGIKRIRFFLSIDTTSYTRERSCTGELERDAGATEHVGVLQGLILDGVNTVQRDQCDFVSLLLPVQRS
jgi:hypothetical protein